jgi:integrase
MSVYRPRRNGKTSKNYVCEFVLHGTRIQESCKTTSKTVAKEYEKRRRAELERAFVGLPSTDKASRLAQVSELCRSYLSGYRLNHRLKSIRFAEGRLKHVDRLLGSFMLCDLTEDQIREYIRSRQREKVSGRTINMELGELSRVVGRTWRELWPKIKKLEERRDIGKALSITEQRALLTSLTYSPSQILRTLVPILLLTGMRSGEAMSLTWNQVDLIEWKITVGRAKTSSGSGRIIPINKDLAKVLGEHLVWFERQFGVVMPSQYLLPWGSPEPKDPYRHVTEVKTAWTRLRQISGVSCRLHDLRHTFATALAEGGASEGTMLALMGHMSRSMLERYSHIRMNAKVQAVAEIRLATEYSVAVPVKVPVAAGRAQTKLSEVVDFSGATRQDRTGDLLITNQPLYQLS